MKINKFLKEWWGIGLIAFIAMLTIFIFGYFYFSKHSLSWLSAEVEELGQMGDFFGGTLNPILAFLSFCLLLITIKLQSKELRNSTRELKKSSKALKKQSKSLKIQNFETTFFNLINFHHKLINDLKFEKKELIYMDKESIYFKENIWLFNQINAIQEVCQDVDNISIKYFYIKFNELYNTYYNKKQNFFNKYINNIEQIFKHISDSKFNNVEKIKYINIFKIQFSQEELKFLFYHCSGNKGSLTLKKYIEEFSFFEFLILEENLNFIFILNHSIYDLKAFKNSNEQIDNIIKSAENYLKKTLLYPTDTFAFNKYVEYCSYCCSLKKYNLAIEKFEDLLIGINTIMEKYPTEDHKTLLDEKKIISDYIYLIKEMNNI